MYKSLGGFSWTGIFRESVLQNECGADDVPSIPSPNNIMNEFIEGSGGAVETGLGDGADSEFNILESAQSLQASLSSLKNVCILIKMIIASD